MMHIYGIHTYTSTFPDFIYLADDVRRTCAPQMLKFRVGKFRVGTYDTRVSSQVLYSTLLGSGKKEQQQLMGRYLLTHV